MTASRAVHLPRLSRDSGPGDPVPVSDFPCVPQTPPRNRHIERVRRGAFSFPCTTDGSARSLEAGTRKTPGAVVGSHAEGRKDCGDV